jgi:hypothetical protein
MTTQDFHALTTAIFTGAALRLNDSGEPAQPAAVTAAHALGAKVDRLGQLAADAAAIKLEADRLRTELENAGLSEIHGANYRANFAQVKGSTRIDWKAIAAKLKPSRQLITAHTSTGTESTRMTIKAHPTH